MSPPSAYIVKQCLKAGGLYDLVNRRCVPRSDVPGFGTTNSSTTTPSTTGVRMPQRTSLFSSISRGGGGAISRYQLPGSFSLTPGTTPGPVNYATPIGPASDPYGMATVAGCGMISNVALKTACMAAAALLRPGGGGNGNGNGGGGGSSLVAQTCPPGYSGTFPDCRTTGMGRFLPGDIGVPDTAWSPVNGRYGTGVVPVAVARERLECPTGYILGKDEICYDRLRKGDRKHNPGTKPFLTGGEVAAIRKANRLKKKFVRLSGGKNALFRMSKKAARAKGRKK